MNTIPEGKQQVYIEVLYKEPIEGIPFSNVGITVGVSKYIGEGELSSEIDQQVQALVQEKFGKLKEQIATTRNEMIDRLREELDKEYSGKLKKAKEIILEQREEIKLLKSKK